MWLLPANKYYQESLNPILFLSPRYEWELFHQLRQILSVLYPHNHHSYFSKILDYITCCQLSKTLLPPASPSKSQAQLPFTTSVCTSVKPVKSRCSSAQAEEMSEQCPGALPFPNRLVPLSKSLSLLHAPSAWVGFGMDGFQLLWKTKGRHIWQSCQTLINRGCDVPKDAFGELCPAMI